MCGISAYIGLTPGYNLAMDGLKMIQNRGYDSSGVCSITDKQTLRVSKYASKKDASAIELLEKDRDIHLNSKVLIMHTRWATHGCKTDENSHPHMCHKNKFALVHNGIIENYADIKKELIEKHSITFKSQTDTEVIVNLISVYYDMAIKELSKNNYTSENSETPINVVETAIKSAINRLEGTWGLVIICNDTPDRLYCARHGSPLLIGINDNYALIASEQSGFCSYVNNYVCLNDNDIVVIEKTNDQVVFKKLHQYEIRKVITQHVSTTPDPYPHWTIKEIHEQYESSLRSIGQGGRLKDDNKVRLGGLDSNISDLMELDNLILLGCGTSYNAGMHVLNLFKQISGFNTVQLFDGAEFSKFDIPKKCGKTGLLLLSQSGETKDLHRCISIAKEENLYMIGVINVVDSQIARDVHCGVYLNAGKEVGVASTKAFTSQVIVLTMIAVWFSQNRNINDNIRSKIIEDLRRLPTDIKTTIQLSHDTCKKVAKYLLDRDSVFILGKNRCESIANEGALKIKEIGYINANGYSSSALRHGPFALLEKGIPIILITPLDEFFVKNTNVLAEVKSREAFVIGVSDSDISELDYDLKIKICQNESFKGLLSVVPLQLIAYELAIMKGHNPDFPKNLAKTITVE